MSFWWMVKNQVWWHKHRAWNIKININWLGSKEKFQVQSDVQEDILPREIKTSQVHHHNPSILVHVSSGTHKIISIKSNLNKSGVLSSLCNSGTQIFWHEENTKWALTCGFKTAQVKERVGTSYCHAVLNRYAEKSIASYMYLHNYGL